MKAVVEDWEEEEAVWEPLLVLGKRREMKTLLRMRSKCLTKDPSQETREFPITPVYKEGVPTPPLYGNHFKALAEDSVTLEDQDEHPPEPNIEAEGTPIEDQAAVV
ncbi:hypothetical protein U1Q18_032795 [Sarracenia purpurea var. burkii]